MTNLQKHEEDYHLHPATDHHPGRNRAGTQMLDIYPAEGTNTFTEYDDDGQKALYPTFVNLGMQNLLTGDAELMKIMFKARKSMKWNAEVTDRMLVDRHMKYITH